MYEVRTHLLYKDGEPVSFKRTPNHGELIKPEIVVVHYTGSNSLSGALNWLCAPEAKVSAHLVIAKTGVVWQLVPFNVKAWHAGVSSYDGRAIGNSVNAFSIGIENQSLGDVWPEAQIEANKAIIEALYKAYDIQDTLGHCDVAPGRKVDPGPLYPWKKIFPDWEG
jgi:N-acetylmuramoyl-L-alanine amidase